MEIYSGYSEDIAGVPICSSIMDRHIIYNGINRRYIYIYRKAPQLCLLVHGTSSTTSIDHIGHG